MSRRYPFSFRKSQKTYARLGPKTLSPNETFFYTIYMKTYIKTPILLLSTLLLTLPAQAQLKGLSKAAGMSSKAAGQLSRQVSREVSYVTRNAQAFAVGLSNSPTKHILNQRFQFQREYARAVALYQSLQAQPTVHPEKLRAQIEKTIINNTLRTSLLNNLDRGYFSGMTQDLEQYFNLTPKLPFFSNKSIPEESFAIAARSYLTRHAHKPSWQLREVIKFGGMRAIRAELSMIAPSPQQAALAYNLNEKEAEQLFALYEQADILNAEIKEFIAKETHTQQEYEEVLVTLRQMNDLYEELLTFAKNSTSVRTTVEIYKNLLADMEKFVAEHHRAPIWQDPLERPLYHLFEPLVFGNQVNMFEEMIPIMTRLYELTEMYPAKRLSEQDTLKDIQEFKAKHGFLPRSVKIRDFFDIRHDEPMLVEAMSYWKLNSQKFVKELDQLMFPQEEDLFPPFF